MAEQRQASLVETVALKKHFYVGRGQTLHAVDGISLAIEENEILGLVGESGSGKSTFGKTLVGLLDKTSGQAFYKGSLLPQKFRTEDFIRYCTQMQMIFQDPYSSLNPRMTVLDIIGEGLQLAGGIGRSEIRDQVVTWLEKVGLHSDHMSRYPHEFSGGQRQRIGVARAMITKPKFVVCDEPISALDVSVQAQVINLLNELKQSMGLTLLFIAHDLSMVRYVSDRMAVMYLGALVEIGPSNDVFFSPKHPYTELLIESNPEPDPQIESERAHRPIEGEITSPINIQPGCRFADRCPKVQDICKHQTPQMTMVSDNHGVVCHLFN
ncbi:MAG: ABC transporter ATP-binding protein [Pseudomonadales bacterium]|jgi:oligopeptide/dipeptide ABC transporter ATP-binding protein|nr:ABC transporter ATP-binding protein [Pseudomonadales bacterium]|tara:strand:- start:1495 stop:2466 length:972 start_codon:yes stop_codon:yes gene_type:complete